MIEAYVDGRPMPRSSSAFTSVASVYRGGGVVEWPCGSSVVDVDSWSPGLERRQPALVVVGRSRPRRGPPRTRRGSRGT